MEKDFDIVVIGSGPGGYVAAIRAAQLGYRTAIVEKYDILGGTCTAVGCIPTKALLDASEHFHDIRTKVGKMGIVAGEPSLDFGKFMSRKDGVVKSNTDGISYLMKKNKIQVMIGTGSFRDNERLAIRTKDNTEKVITSNYFIIATGSKPATIPGVTIDKDRIITSTEALSLKSKPESIVIIGGGVIGVEMASIYGRIGSKITIIEYADMLVPTMDGELCTTINKILAIQGVSITLGCKVQSAVNNGANATVCYLDPSGAQKQITADYCLVAAGRKPYTRDLGLENTRIQVDKAGRILTKENLETAVPNIYAIGDVIAGPMLAHKAEEEAVFVVDKIHEFHAHLNYLLVPSVVYTWPEMAGVGYTEEQLKEKGIPYRKGRFPFIASGRARAADDTEGFAKVLSDAQYGEILGVHIIGARAADLIQQAIFAMRFEITDVEMGKLIYAHPTYSEVLKDAFLEASGNGAINI